MAQAALYPLMKKLRPYQAAQQRRPILVYAGLLPLCIQGCIYGYVTGTSSLETRRVAPGASYKHAAAV
jgi:hypothetical protein